MTVRVSLLGSYGQGPGVRCKHLMAACLPDERGGKRRWPGEWEQVEMGVRGQWGGGRYPAWRWRAAAAAPPLRGCWAAGTATTPVSLAAADWPAR
eukprot:767925-Prorocentrum_minimum.AAC.1